MSRRNPNRPVLPYARTSSVLTSVPQSASASHAAVGDPGVPRTYLDVPHVDEVRPEPDLGVSGVAGLLADSFARRRGGLEPAG